jgi:hypothetical protein
LAADTGRISNGRRNITKGQKAIACAMLFLIAVDKGGRGKKKISTASAGVFSDTLLSRYIGLFARACTLRM